MSATSILDLPPELLYQIFDQNLDFDDLLICALVCTLWQSLVKLLYHRHKSTAPALWLLPPRMDRKREYCRIYNTLSGRTHQIFLPEILGRWFAPACHGWLLTIPLDNNQPHSIYLLNPLTRARVKLPWDKQFRIPESSKMDSKNPEFSTVIASASPDDPSCTFLAIHPCKSGHRFSLCKTGDRAWNRGIHNFEGRCSDAIFYKGDFYAMNLNGFIWVIRQKAVRLSMPSVQCRPWITDKNYYLVEMKGDLLTVASIPRSGHFRVYRLDWEKKMWVPEKTVGDNAIFVGRFSSYLVPATQKEQVFASFKEEEYASECILFIDDGPNYIGRFLGASMVSASRVLLYRDAPVLQISPI